MGGTATRWGARGLLKNKNTFCVGRWDVQLNLTEEMPRLGFMQDRYVLAIAKLRVSHENVAGYLSYWAARRRTSVRRIWRRL
jgi:hypothetical protein